MSVDQETQAVVRLSAVVERAQAQLDDARRAHVVAAERQLVAQRQLDAAVRALEEAVKTKAVADIRRTQGPDSSEAFLMRYSGRMEVTGEALKDVARRSFLAGQVAAEKRFLNGSFQTSATARPATVAGINVVITNGAHMVPISVQVRELFRSNPNVSLTANEVQTLLKLPSDKEPVVRQNLRRLYEAHFLLREDRGVYMLNPVPHPPPPIEED